MSDKPGVALINTLEMFFKATSYPLQMRKHFELDGMQIYGAFEVLLVEFMVRLQETEHVT